jgi:hypothetical protein
VKSLSTVLVSAALGASMLAFSSLSAAAAIACSGNVCWHSHDRLDYPPKAHITIHEDNWTGVRMSTTRSVSMKAEATGPATLGPSSNRPDTVACAMRPPQWGGLILGQSRLPLEKRPPRAAALHGTCGAQAGPWISAIKTATTGAPAVEQPAHHGVARPAKRIEAAGHSIDRRVILSRSGKTERASPCRGISLPDRRPGEQQESCRRNRERDLTHVSLIGLGPLSPVGMRDPMQPLVLAQFCLGGTRRTSAAAS